MSTAISLSGPVELAELEALVDRANGYAADARARSTRTVYHSMFKQFQAWCEEKGLASLPTRPEIVAIYVTHLADAGRAASTLQVVLAAIADAHRSRGYPWPRTPEVIGEVMRGIRRRVGVAAKTRKAALEGEHLQRIVTPLGSSLVDARDRALLCVGWWGAFRRAELASLHVHNLTDTPEGILVTVERSKRDQEGRGRVTPLPYAARAEVCPVRALRAWREAAGIKSGPLFRAVDEGGRVADKALCGRTVARIIQRAARRAGLDPTVLGGHSLRAGFCTTAARRGRSLDAIMRHTGHRDERVARGYVRIATAFQDSAATDLVF